MLLEEILRQDIFNLLQCVSIKFNIPLNILLKRYIPNIKPYKKIKRKRTDYGKKQCFNIPKDYKCIARCWGGKDSVKYIVKEKKWIYGTQCKIHKYGITNYCLTHLKQVKKKGHPEHGDFDKKVHHNHYLKYKKKIELKFRLQEIITE
jgi:hypothetical protein